MNRGTRFTDEQLRQKYFEVIQFIKDGKGNTEAGCQSVNVSSATLYNYLNLNGLPTPMKVIHGDKSYTGSGNKHRGPKDNGNIDIPIKLKSRFVEFIPKESEIVTLTVRGIEIAFARQYLEQVLMAIINKGI